MINCITCGAEFEPKRGPGRPRRRCYVCRPERTKSAKRAAKRTQEQEHVSLQQVVAAHCPWCGAYPPPGEAFCNPRHRAMFSERVAAAADAKLPRDSSGRTIGNSRARLRSSSGKRPLERVRQMRDEQLEQERSIQRSKRAQQVAA